MTYHTKINKLLFADDLAIFSLPKEDLQKRISIVEQYSNEWGLELNLSKKIRSNYKEI